VSPALSSVIAVGLGGAAGSIMRYGLSGAAQRFANTATFPIGTLVVNVAGCLGIGVLAGLADGRFMLGPHARAFLFLGVLGGFTTFSTFGYETMMLARDGEHLRALANVFLQVALCLTAAWMGLAMTRAW
jgi:CrcB protein